MKYGLIERDFVNINEAIREFPEIVPTNEDGNHAYSSVEPFVNQRHTISEPTFSRLNLK